MLYYEVNFDLSYTQKDRFLGTFRLNNKFDSRVDFYPFPEGIEESHSFVCTRPTKFDLSCRQHFSPQLLGSLN
jgi:hypothetical protein